VASGIGFSKAFLECLDTPGKRFEGPTGLKDIEEVVLVLSVVLIVLVVILFILLSMTKYPLI